MNDADILKLAPILDAIRRTADDPKFRDRHGDIWSEIMKAVVPDPDHEWPGSGFFELSDDQLATMPAYGALWQVTKSLLEAKQHPDVMARDDVVQLCDVLQWCVHEISATRGNALDAFATVFTGAYLRIANKQRATSRHALKRSTLEAAWTHFKKANYASLAEGARACANHYREPGAPSQRAFLDYFRKQAKAEGLIVKPGRKSTTKPKNKLA